MSGTDPEEGFEYLQGYRTWRAALVFVPKKVDLGEWCRENLSGYLTNIEYEVNEADHRSGYIQIDIGQYAKSEDEVKDLVDKLKDIISAKFGIEADTYTGPIVLS